MNEQLEHSSNGSSGHGSPGRPTKYSEETITKLCDALADGMPLKSACAVAGIGVQTLADWRKDNPELEARIEAAKEKLRQKALQTIGKCIEDGDWRAAESALKLAFPEYRENRKVEVNTATNNFILPKLSAEQIRDLQERRARLLSEIQGSRPQSGIEVS